MRWVNRSGFFLKKKKPPQPDKNHHIMASKVVNPRVFFDIAIGKNAPARVVMELFADTTPKVRWLRTFAIS